MDTVNDDLKGWLRDNLPKLPKRRRWKISIEAEKNNEDHFYLVISIQYKILFWWVQDEYNAGYRYKPLMARLRYSVTAAPDLHEIQRHAKHLKNVHYPDPNIPKDFQDFTGTY